MNALYTCRPIADTARRAHLPEETLAGWRRSDDRTRLQANSLQTGNFSGNSRNSTPKSCRRHSRNRCAAVASCRIPYDGYQGKKFLRTGMPVSDQGKLEPCSGRRLGATVSSALPSRAAILAPVAKVCFGSPNQTVETPLPCEGDASDVIFDQHAQNAVSNELMSLGPPMRAPPSLRIEWSALELREWNLVGLKIAR